LVGANGSGKNYSNHFDFVCVSVSVNLK